MVVLGIRQRIILGFLLITLLSGILLYALSRDYEQNAKDIGAQRVQLLAQLAANQVNSYFERIEQRTQSYASDGKIIDLTRRLTQGDALSLEPLLEHLNFKRSVDTTLRKIAITNNAGTIVLSTDSSLNGTQKDVTPFFRREEPVPRSVFIGRYVEEDENRFEYAAPLLTEEGETSGFIFTTFALPDDLIMRSERKEGDAIYLVMDWVVVQEDSAMPEPLERSVMGLIPLAQQCLDAEEEFKGFYVNSLGREVYATTVCESTVKAMVIVETKAALLPLESVNVSWIFLFYGALLTLALLFAVLLINGILRPLEDLTRAIRLITRGRLETRLPHSKVPEIGQLIDAIERILASLKLAILRSDLDKDAFELGKKPNVSVLEQTQGVQVSEGRKQQDLLKERKEKQA